MSKMNLQMKYEKRCSAITKYADKLNTFKNGSEVRSTFFEEFVINNKLFETEKEQKKFDWYCGYFSMSQINFELEPEEEWYWEFISEYSGIQN